MPPGDDYAKVSVLLHCRQGFSLRLSLPFLGLWRRGKVMAEDALERQRMWELLDDHSARLVKLETKKGGD